MLRVVVAVVLAGALLAVSLPVVETARIDHAETRVATALDRLDVRATRLDDRNDPTRPGLSGARRTLTLHLPSRSWGSAGLDYLAIPGPDGEIPRQGASADARITWRVTGGNRSAHRPSLRLVGPEGGLLVRQGGTRRVVLTLARVDGQRTVVVSRPGFKSEDGTRPDYAADFDPEGPAVGYRRRPIGLWLRPERGIGDTAG
ncbi:MAG: hypothetical protein ACI8XM_002786 [Haloarculaceae archaeon]|jgi:hypothetical protein